MAAGCFALAAALLIVIGSFMIHPGLGVIILGAYIFIIIGESRS